MSKFLKFIVHLIVICAIVCALGLTIPPFFGVNTVVIDDSSQKTNLPMGSVTYAIPKRAEDVFVGEPVLVQEDSSIYRYEMRTLNLENGTGTVVDPSVTNGQPITVAVKDYVPKIVITIAYIGYLQVALKSTEGIIILGLGLLFLIILYVIAELWRKDKNRRDEEDEDDEDEEDDDEDDEEEVPVKSKKELRREEKERARKLKEEEDDLEEEERSEKKSRKKKKKEEKRKVHTGGFVDEIDEDDDEDDDDEEPLRREPVKEAHESLKKGIAAATNHEESEEEISPAEAVYRKLEEENRRAAGAKQQEAEKESKSAEMAKQVPTLESEADLQEKASETHRRAIPGYTAAELADKAKKAGDSPDVVKDDVTEITLFDYSDILDSDQGSK